MGIFPDRDSVTRLVGAVRLRTNGDVVRYNPGSNTFGVMDSSGAPRTYFRPDPAQHGYPTNLDYFNAQ